MVELEHIELLGAILEGNEWWLKVYDFTIFCTWRLERGTQNC